MKLSNLDKVVGVIIRLRKIDNPKESKNKLIAMLEELLRKESISIGHYDIFEIMDAINNGNDTVEKLVALGFDRKKD